MEGSSRPPRLAPPPFLSLRPRPARPRTSGGTPAPKAPLLPPLLLRPLLPPPRPLPGRERAPPPSRRDQPSGPGSSRRTPLAVLLPPSAMATRLSPTPPSSPAGRH